MNEIGVIERLEPSFDFSWVKNLKDINIISSKNLTDSLIDILLNNKSKIIYHHNVTGFGGTSIEPGIYSIEESKKQVNKLINRGFSLDQIVLRIHPIIPTQKGLDKFEEVLESYKDTYIKRVRLGFLVTWDRDKSNEHFTKMLKEEKFNCKVQEINESLVLNIIRNRTDYEYETCIDTGSFMPYALSCASGKDIRVLKLAISINSSKGVLRCPDNRVELLTLDKHNPCPGRCAYCFYRAKI